MRAEIRDTQLVNQLCRIGKGKIQRIGNQFVMKILILI